MDSGGGNFRITRIEERPFLKFKFLLFSSDGSDYCTPGYRGLIAWHTLSFPAVSSCPFPSTSHQDFLCSLARTSCSTSCSLGGLISGSGAVCSKQQLIEGRRYRKSTAAQLQCCLMKSRCPSDLHCAGTRHFNADSRPDQDFCRVCEFSVGAFWFGCLFIVANITFMYYTRTLSWISLDLSDFFARCQHLLLTEKHKRRTDKTITENDF